MIPSPSSVFQVREGAQHNSVFHFQMVFSQDHHEHVLNLCLAQFEPDSADYIKVL